MSSLPEEASLSLNDDDLPVLQVSSGSKLPREGLVLGLVCLALAAVLHFLRLGRREVFGEEFFTLDVLGRGTVETSLSTAVLEGHLPLYYWLLQGWHALVGATESGREGFLRLPSALLSFATCVVFFFHVSRYLRGMAFAMAMLLVALNPALTASAHEATPFALLGLVAVVTHHFGLRAFDEGGGRRWAAYALAVGVGLLTSPLFWFLLLGQWIFAVAHPRRIPKPFLLLSGAGTLLGVFGVVAASFYSSSLSGELEVRPPAIDDLIKALVALTLGDFPRHGVNSFFRAVMYLLFLVSLGLSGAFYKIRSMEASAMPEGIGWIDQTQDVVGTWRRLSMRSFLSYQWITFLVPAAGVLILGTCAPKFDLDAEQLIVCLPSLAVLIALGIDFAPGRGGKLACGLFFVLIMAYYDLQTLMFRGYGVRHAIEKLSENAEYNPSKDLYLYTVPAELTPAVQRYKSSLPGLEPIPIRGPETPEELAQVTRQATQLAEGKERVFVIYHKDLRNVNKNKVTPVREVFSALHGWQVDSHWQLSPQMKTELRIYSRLAPPAQKAGAARPSESRDADRAGMDPTTSTLETSGSQPPR